MPAPRSDHRPLPPRPRKAGRRGPAVERADSGFVDSRPLRLSVDTGRSSLSNGDCAPLRPRTKPSRRPSEEVPGTHPAMNEPQSTGSSSTSSSTTPRRKSDARRPSVVSSINSTANTPRHRSSRPSSRKSFSRRTTALVIHQASSPTLRGAYQTVPPQPAPDVDAVYGLHHRSCTLFRSISTAGRPELLPTAVASRMASSTGLACVSALSLAPSVPDTAAALDAYRHVPPTTIHWTSPGTRRREYDEIDRRCRGFRGLLARMRPRWGTAAAAPTRFYDADAASDMGSVRRYRLDLPETEDEEGDEFEKMQGQGQQEGGSTESLHGEGQGKRKRKSESESKRTPRPGLAKLWGCF